MIRLKELIRKEVQKLNEIERKKINIIIHWLDAETGKQVDIDKQSKRMTKKEFDKYLKRFGRGRSSLEYSWNGGYIEYDSE